MRRQSKSYNEISASLGIAKSTLSEWLKNDPSSQKTKRMLSGIVNPRVAERIKKFSELNKTRWAKFRSNARLVAHKEFSSHFKNPLFVAGLMLYWGEGDSKPKNPLRLTNSSSNMIELYVKFLRQVLDVPKIKIKVGLILYKDIDQADAINFWSHAIGLPQDQFYKTQYIKGHHPTKRLKDGICMVIVNSAHLKEKVLTWIALLSKKL